MEAATLIVIVLDLYFPYDQAVGAPGSDLRRHRHVPELAVMIPQISARSTVRISPGVNRSPGCVPPLAAGAWLEGARASASAARSVRIGWGSEC